MPDTGNMQAAGSGGSFAAIDFETATGKRSSACAVGVVVFEHGQATEKFHMLIRPPGNQYHSYVTDRVHGISPSDTENAAAFPEVWEQFAPLLAGRLVVAHNAAFDLSVLRDSAKHYGHRTEPFPYVCTLSVARTVMPGAPKHSLGVLARKFGIPLTHHDPLSDANAAGLLWLVLQKRYGVTAMHCRGGQFRLNRQLMFTDAAS